MNDIALVEFFWRDCDDANFSKEAAVLFFFLVKIYRERRTLEVKMHPAKLSSVIKGFNPASVAQATEELEKRGYISYAPPTEDCSSGIYRFVKATPPKRVRSKNANDKLQGTSDKL